MDRHIQIENMQNFHFSKKHTDKALIYRIYIDEESELIRLFSSLERQFLTYTESIITC